MGERRNRVDKFTFFQSRLILNSKPQVGRWGLRVGLVKLVVRGWGRRSGNIVPRVRTGRGALGMKLWGHGNFVSEPGNFLSKRLSPETGFSEAGI